MYHSLRPVSDKGAGDALYLNEEFSDVSVIVRDNGFQWRFPAHSLLLSTQSTVFRCMLSSDFSESSSRQIVIEDISPSTVERLLKYIYCGTVDLENWKEGIELLKAAHKYQIDHLVQKCATFLQAVITLLNVCYIFNEATIYSLSKLKEKCLRLILDAGFVVLRSKTFEILSKEAVLEIVSDSKLNIDSELTVFDALLRWAPLQCCRGSKSVTEENILLELQPFLQYVCFDDMSDTDKSALPTSVLSCMKPNNRNRIGFTMLRGLLSHGNVINLEVDHNNYKPISEILNCIRFSMNSPMYLISISITMMVNDNPSRFPVVLSNENAGDTHVFIVHIAREEWRRVIDLPNKKIFRAEIVLRQPVHLDAKTVYKMFCNVDYSNSQYFFQTKMVNGNICTTTGNTRFSIHSEETYGITSLVFLNAMGK